MKIKNLNVLGFNSLLMLGIMLTSAQLLVCGWLQSQAKRKKTSSSIRVINLRKILLNQ